MLCVFSLSNIARRLIIRPFRFESPFFKDNCLSIYHTQDFYQLKLPDFLKIFSDKDFLRRNLPMSDDEKWSVEFGLIRLEIRRYVMVKQDA